MASLLSVLFLVAFDITGLLAHSPSCIPQAPEGMVFISGTNEVGDTVTFMCEDGYVLRGSSTASCQYNGKWAFNGQCLRYLHRIFFYTFNLGIEEGINF